MSQEQEKLVMYVDGDHVVADAVKMFADKLEFGRMMIAHSVQEAIETATNVLPQRMAAVIFPTMLPDGRGIDLLNAQDKDTHTKLFGEDTAKVLVTSDRSEETTGMYLNQGVGTILYKPVGPERLTRIVDGLVKDAAVGRDQ